MKIRPIRAALAATALLLASLAIGPGPADASQPAQSGRVGTTRNDSPTANSKGKSPVMTVLGGKRATAGLARSSVITVRAKDVSKGRRSDVGTASSRSRPKGVKVESFKGEAERPSRTGR